MLPVRWVDAPKFFCDFSETLVYLANNIVNMLIQVPWYGAIPKNPNTETVPTQTLERINHIDYYMDAVTKSLKGRPKLKGKALHGTI